MTAGTEDFAPVRFSTDNLPEQERLPAWRDMFGRMMLHVDITPLSDQPFQTKATFRALPGLRMLSCVNTAAQYERTPELVADGNCDLSMVINLGGPATVCQRGREVTLDAGDATLISSVDPATFIKSQMRWAGVVVPFGTMFIQSQLLWTGIVVPRGALLPLVSHPEDAAARLIPHDTEALKLLISYVTSMREELTLATPEVRHATVTHVHDLFALAIGATRDATDLIAARGLRAARVREILSEIKNGFSDPSFSPAIVATKLRLSRRYVQNLLHETGTSFVERVTELRLQKARGMLISPGGDRLTVGEIAYACGFNEVSYFNRCFRRRFGDSPTAFRGQGGFRDASPSI